MTEPVHSHIGASSMHRWAACPGSVRLSKNIESKSSVYAAEGTKAHEVAAYVLSEGEWPENVDPEMAAAVQIYVGTVLDDWGKCAKAGVLHIERRFDLSSLHHGLFGTADAVLYDPESSILRVYDYKHGAGIAVDVTKNVQLMYYGLGALLSTGYGAKTVELIIVQPRCPHPEGIIRRWSFSAVELIDFAADLVEFAKATERPDAPLNPGEHCRFCPAAGICSAIHDQALVAAQAIFTHVTPYDPAKLTEVYGKLPMLEAWIKSVKEFAYAEAMHGRCPPGLKLVAKRATRKWRDENEASRRLLEAFNVAPTDIFETSLKSPAQVEKILSKDDKKKLADLVTAESSGNVLVTADDPRPSVEVGAASVFTALPLNT